VQPLISGCPCLKGGTPDRAGLLHAGPDRAKPKTNGGDWRYTCRYEGEDAFDSPTDVLFRFAPVLLAIALPGQGRLHPALLTRFQVVRVPLHFFDDVLLLDFPLEATQSILEGLALLKPHFSHLDPPPFASDKKLQITIIHLTVGVKAIIAGEAPTAENFGSKPFYEHNVLGGRVARLTVWPSPPLLSAERVRTWEEMTPEHFRTNERGSRKAFRLTRYHD